MYSHRSGCRLGLTDKRLLRWVALLPFIHNFLTGPEVGLHWLAPAGLLAQPAMKSGIDGLRYVLPFVAFVAPLLLIAKGGYQIW